MPEFPIVLAEQLNTYEEMDVRFGWKLTVQSPTIVQFTIHRMDPRPGFDRLVNESVYFRNIGIPALFNEVLDDIYWRMAYGEFNYIGREGLNYWGRVNNVVSPSSWLGVVVPLLETEELRELAPFCGPCDTYGHTEFDNHAECAHECGEYGLASSFNVYSVLQQVGPYGTERVDFHICHGCMDTEGLGGLGVIYCSACGEYATENVVERTVRYEDMNGVNVCRQCMDYAVWCASGNHWVNEDHIAEWEDDGDVSENICGVCITNQDNPRRWIMSWNYRPPLDFYPELPTDPMRPLYIGLELEMSWPDWQGRNRQKANDWLQELTEDHPVLYVKSDSSVHDGFEVVTHPMEPSWALEHFPFDFFQRAIDEGALPEHPSTGTHIHVSKAALTTAQMYKLIQLHLKLKDLCGIVGGRGTDNDFARWRDTGIIRDNLKEIARKKGEAFGDGARYVPVNVRNEETLELRYMAGSIQPESIRKNIQWVQALYDFTEHISIEDIKNGVLNNQNYLLGWIFDRDYPSVASYLATNIMMPVPMPARSV